MSLLIVIDYQRPNARAARTPIEGYHKQFLERALLSCGTHIDDCRICLSSDLPSLEGTSAILAIGNKSLQVLTEHSGIDKHHLSMYPCKLDPSVKVVPTFHPERITKDFRMNMYFQMAIKKCLDHIRYPKPEVERRYITQPTVDESMTELDRILGLNVPISVDIETSRGQINTIGFATDPYNAIAIQINPKKWGHKHHKEVWEKCATIIEEMDTIYQNCIYEAMYFSLYGIRIGNVHHDTMWAQKFLWPEFEMGLDNVGRMYTTMPYWKEDNKNWNNITDWKTHLEYNCKDTSGTYEGMLGQKVDLVERGLWDTFYGFVMKFHQPLIEMCCNGLPVNEHTRKQMEIECNEKIKTLIEGLSKDINPRSSKQKLELFREKGYKIPKVRSGNTWRESANETSLKKLRLKHPQDNDIRALLELAKLQKALSSYITSDYSDDGRMRYTLTGVGTETGRWAGHKDPWNRGVNPQTIPSRGQYNIKKIFDANENFFFQVDLAQAESRFVAYDSCEAKLIDMLEGGEDVHKFVASHIFHKPEDQINKEERQLGKKSGHGANYAMGVGTFVDSCLKEMDKVIDRKTGQRILDTYHELFPGIRRWHGEILQKVCTYKRLDNPMGRERVFYGRLNDDTFREAYAYRPQSTIPDIINALMLYLYDYRKQHKMTFKFLLQVHDSLVLEAPEGELDELYKITTNTDNWHPKIDLAAGRLVIPVDAEYGKSWGALKAFKG